MNHLPWPPLLPTLTTSLILASPRSRSRDCTMAIIEPGLRCAILVWTFQLTKITGIYLHAMEVGTNLADSPLNVHCRKFKLNDQTPPLGKRSMIPMSNIGFNLMIPLPSRRVLWGKHVFVSLDHSASNCQLTCEKDDHNQWHARVWLLCP